MKVAYEFSRILFEYRDYEDISQRELSKRLGLGENVVQYYEMGTHMPSITKAEKILDKLGYKLQIVEK